MTLQNRIYVSLHKWGFIVPKHGLAKRFLKGDLWGFLCNTVRSLPDDVKCPEMNWSECVEQLQRKKIKNKKLV